MTTVAIIIAVTAFLCTATWCSAWRAIRFKQSDDWVTAQREGYSAQRNVARDMAKQWVGPDQHDDA